MIILCMCRANRFINRFRVMIDFPLFKGEISKFFSFLPITRAKFS